MNVDRREQQRSDRVGGPTADDPRSEVPVWP